MKNGTKHIVEQGQSCESIAAEHGLFWQALWHHPQNAELKKLRTGPNCLYPGDELFVPAPEPKQVPVSTGRHHRFRRKGVPSKLHLVFMNGGRPYADQPYVMDIEGELLPGRTDKDGAIIMAVAPTVGVIKLRFHNDLLARVHTFQPRTLHPPSTPSGIADRLLNLGYGPQTPAAADDAPDVRFSDALRMFRQDNGQNGSETTGEMDESTQALLESRHGV